MGELILIDRVTNMTSACGVVREVNEAANDVKEVDAAFRAELNNQKPVVVETVLSDKINVDFLKKVEKELLLDSLSISVCSGRRRGLYKCCDSPCKCRYCCYSCT